MAAGSGIAGKLPKANARVTHSVVLTNGVRNITTSSIFTFTANPAYDTGSLVCTMLNETGESLPVAVGSALPLDLLAGATINCDFEVTVTPAHQGTGNMPAISLAAGFTNTPMDYSFAVKPTASDPVVVASGIRLEPASTFDVTGLFTPGALSCLLVLTLSGTTEVIMLGSHAADEQERAAAHCKSTQSLP